MVGMSLVSPVSLHGRHESGESSQFNVSRVSPASLVSPVSWVCGEPLQAIPTLVELFVHPVN